ncbi:hypothetical protein [Vibrio tapetis]|uniref:Uncharacterized protein n=1 Tax=Vibrio tapetis subsp. tapetis TaxID=1671868 RepID=A0A2N8ZHY9_9VIBR|nr:hypothetical protein [Vibrio tapetis]SON51517.1 conserved protein of unknown function [Vibrio tapetis subsp. tapetis]
MGRAKPVIISGRLFEKQGAAVSYFVEQKEERLASGLIKEGELYDALKDVYERYCDNSSGYELNGRLITAFSVAYEKRQISGMWVTNACYKVHFSNDEIRPFSIAKAVKSVASNS